MSILPSQRRYTDSAGTFDYEQDLYLTHSRPGVPGRGFACLLNASNRALDASLLARLHAQTNPFIVWFRRSLRFLVIVVSFPLYLIGYVIPNWISQMILRLIAQLRPPVMRAVNRIVRPVVRLMRAVEQGGERVSLFAEQMVSRASALSKHYAQRVDERLTILADKIAQKIQRVLAPISRRLTSLLQWLEKQSERLRQATQQKLEQLQGRLHQLHERALLRTQYQREMIRPTNVLTRGAHLAAWVRVVPSYTLHLVNEAMHEVIRWFK